MACKLICDHCRGEINPAASRVFLKISTYDKEETYDLCASCAFHLHKWVDGEERLVNVLEGI